MPKRLSKPTPARPHLDALLKKAVKHKMTPAEIKEQRISFVYGQMMDCSPGITKEDVRRIANEMYDD